MQSWDTFGVSPAPFNFFGKPKSTSLLGGFVAMTIKFVTTTFLLLKLNEMIYFSQPYVSQITIQGTPKELNTVYGEKQLGNTTFAI